jgi:hypothetical protein
MTFACTPSHATASTIACAGAGVLALMSTALQTALVVVPPGGQGPGRP